MKTAVLDAAEKSVLVSWHIHQLLADLHVECMELAVTAFVITALKFTDFYETPSNLTGCRWKVHEL